jgi:hypothetical protein
LGQKEHEADRWVAAPAIWLRVPLVAHDRIFTNVKDLELLTKLGAANDRAEYEKAFREGSLEGWRASSSVS